MGCDLVFFIAGKEIRVDNTTLSASDNSLEKVAQILIENQKQHNDLQNLITQSKSSEVNSVTEEDLAKDGLMGNTSLDRVVREYPKVDWPTDVDDYQMNILLVKSLKYNGKSAYGRVIDKHGNELFVLQDNFKDLQKFANYLKVRNQIESYTEDDEELNNIVKKLIGQWKEKSPKTVKELLVDFQNNEARYRDLYFDGVDVYGTLNDTLRGLNGKSQKMVYQDPLVNAVNSRLSWRNNTPRISKDQFYRILASTKPEVVEDLKSKGITKTELLNNEELLKQVIEDYFINAETDLDFEVSAINNKNIVFKNVPQTLENRYGFTYNTINDLVTLVEDYRGYHIYQYNDNGTIKYLYDRNVISTVSWSKLVPSIEKVKSNIDRRILTNDTLANSSNIEFKLRSDDGQMDYTVMSPKSVKEGTLIDSLDVEIKKRTTILADEEPLLKGKLQDFYDYFQQRMPSETFQKVMQIVDTAEKAAIFVYKINEDLYWQRTYDQEQLDKIDDILDSIQNAQHTYYFIEKKIGPVKVSDYKDPVYFLKIIPTQSRVELNSHFNRPQPVIGLINDVVDTLNSKFGVGATVLTAEEIAQQFSDVDANAKAFIRDGKIYINGSIASSTDAIHEYTHLFLGVLKAQNFDLYQTLLESIMRDKKASKRKARLARLYPNIANSDLNEEVFVSLFSEYLSGKDKSLMFAPANQQLNSDLQKTIFNLASTEDFNTLYQGNMYHIFSKFSSDIGKVGNGLDFSVGTIYRKAANWIADKISKNEIIEKC